MLWRVCWRLTLPVAAQEQTGQIQGSVKDSSGAMLPGVTVELTNTSLGSVAATVVTDANGVYRVPGLRPGKYEALAKLAGFTPAKTENIELRLGQILTIDLALAVGGVTETVSVTAESPIIDTKQSARNTNITAEKFERLPKGRDFSTIVTQAPGANKEPRSGGISIDGSSASENRWIIDGAETTNINQGTSAKPLVTDFVEEVQVKSSGYNAEYGGSTGGVINVVTRSGTNRFRGDVLTYFSGDSLDSDNRTNYAPEADQLARVRERHVSRGCLQPLWSRAFQSAARSSRIGCGSSAASWRRCRTPTAT